MNEYAAKKNGRLTPLMFAIVLLVASPPMIVDFFKLPPAVWLNNQQSEIFGGDYYPKITAVLLMTGYAAAIFIVFMPLALLVRKLTGRTVVQWLKGEKAGNPKAGQ